MNISYVSNQPHVGSKCLRRLRPRWTCRTGELTVMLKVCWSMLNQLEKICPGNWATVLGFVDAKASLKTKRSPGKAMTCDGSELTGPSASFSICQNSSHSSGEGGTVPTVHTTHQCSRNRKPSKLWTTKCHTCLCCSSRTGGLFWTSNCPQR